MICLPLVVSCVSGLPQELGSALLRGPHDWTGICEFVKKHVKKSDQVLVGDLAYYPAVISAGEVYHTGYSGGRGLRIFPGQQADQVTVMIIHPSEYDKCVGKVGGTWTLVGSYGIDEAWFLMSGIRLSCYRRSSDR